MSLFRALALYNPASDAGTLSGGSWVANLPLAHMQTEDLHRVARSSDTDPASTRFDLVLPAPSVIRGLVVFGTFSPVARLRWTKHASAAFTTPVLGGEWGEPAGRRARFGTHPWAPGWWTGFSPWPEAGRGHALRHYFAEPVTVQFLRLEIDDQSNPAGFLDIGRLFVADGLQTSINYAYEGNGLTWRNNGQTQTSLSGRKFHRRRINPRRWTGQFDTIPEAEAYDDVYRFLSANGWDRQIWFTPAPGTPFAAEREFFASLTEIDPLAQIAFGRAGAGYTLEEIVG